MDLIFEFAMFKLCWVPIFMQFEEPLIFSGFDLFLGPFGYGGVERVKNIGGSKLEKIKNIDSQQKIQCLYKKCVVNNCP